MGLVLMGGAVLSKSLIQFSVDGWSYVSSLLFTWGYGNPLQCSCLENPMEGGAWLQSTVYGVAKSRTRLKDFTFFHHSLAPGK